MVVQSKLKVVLACLLLAGCAQIGAIGDWVNENPMAADIVVRQSVARMIDASDDPAAKATRVVEVLEVAAIYLDGNPTTTVAELLVAMNDAIRWDNMSVPDQLLVQDLLAIIQLDLTAKVGAGDLGADADLGLRSMINTAKRTAGLYAS